MRTDQEIIDQTNELARELLLMMGYQVAEDFKFYSTDQCHPKIHAAWEMAKKAQEILTETEVENALAELEIDDSCYYKWTKTQQREWNKLNNPKSKKSRTKKATINNCQHPHELLEPKGSDIDDLQFRCRGCDSIV